MASIYVEVKAPLHESHIEPFRSLLGDLTQAVPIPAEVTYLEIRVVPPHTVGVEVNRIAGGEIYSPDSPPHGAVILPQCMDGQLTCTIVIAVDEFDGLSEPHRPDGLVSTLLEELLHAQVYGIRWRHHGNFLVAQNQYDDRFEIIASRLHDEYVVTRAKNELASSLPLFDALGMPGYRTQRIFTYDGNLASLLARAQREVEALRESFHSGRLQSGELESVLAMQVVYRIILDPLGRSHGFMDGMPLADRERFPLLPPHGNFFDTYVAPRWQRIHLSMHDSYSSGLLASRDAIQSIAVEILGMTNDLNELIRRPQPSS